MKNHCNYWIFAFFRHNRNKYNLKEGMNDEKICIRYVSRYCYHSCCFSRWLQLLKTVIDPIEEKEDMIEENRKKRCVSVLHVKNSCDVEIKI